MREEMRAKMQEQHTQIGEDIEQLKKYWTSEQDKRDKIKKREEELKEVNQRKERLEREQAQIVTQNERDEELLRRLTAATAAITRQVVTSMTRASGDGSRVMNAIITQDDGSKHNNVTPQKESNNKTGPPSGGQL